MTSLFKLTAFTLALGAAHFANASPYSYISNPVPVVAAPNGGTLLSSMSSFFSGAGVSGELRSAVYANPDKGTDFYYQIVSSPGSFGAIEQLIQRRIISDPWAIISGGGYSGSWYSQTNAAFGIFTQGSVRADAVTDVIYGACDPTCFEFYDTSVAYLPGLTSGAASYTAFNHVNSYDYVSTTFSVNGLDNGLDVMALAPPIPEPETYAMFLAGLGLIGSVIRRKKMTATCID